jgi:predicted metal-dependent peptidase
MSETPECLAAARLKLSRERPYLNAALWVMQLRPIVDGMKKGMAGPMGVDPWFRLYYDPEAISKWPVSEIAAVLYHEVGHLLREHAHRAERMRLPFDDTRVVWNLAGDCEINDDIEGDGMALPKGACTPKAMGLTPHLFAEEYFELMMQGKSPKVKIVGPGSGGCGSGAGGEKGEWEDGPPVDGRDGVSPAEGRLVRDKVAQDVRQHAKSRGTVPGWLSRWAEQRLTAVVDWRKTLAAMVRRACGDVRGLTDFTYTRPSRRGGALKDIILPAMRQPTPRVAVVVDTSGSMGERELAQALAEIDGVLMAIGQREGVTVMAVDAAVAATKRVMKSRDVVLAGGGGTDMRVGLSAAVALRPRPDVIVCVTDCATPWPMDPIGVPLIVAATVRDGVWPGWAKGVCVVAKAAA